MTRLADRIVAGCMRSRLGLLFRNDEPEAHFREQARNHLGAVDDRCLLGRVVHALLREGGPDQIRGQVFEGLLFSGLDALTGEDVEAGVSPTVEHADELQGDLLLRRSMASTFTRKSFSMSLSWKGG